MVTKMTVEEVGKKWIQELEEGAPSETFDKERDYLENHLIANLGTMWLFNLDSSILQTMYRLLEEEEILNQDEVKELQNVAVELFDYARDEGFVESNPARVIELVNSEGMDKGVAEEVVAGEEKAYDEENGKVSEADMDKNLINIWSVDESNRFLKKVEESQFYIVYHLSLTSGGTVGEILALTWDDVDFENETVHYNKYTNDAGKTIRQGELEERVVPLTSSAMLALYVERDRQRERLRGNPHNLVAAGKSGQYIFGRNVSTNMAKYMERAEVPKIRFKDLRHTYLARLMEKDLNPVEIKRRLGFRGFSFLVSFHQFYSESDRRIETL